MLFSERSMSIKLSYQLTLLLLLFSVSHSLLVQQKESNDADVDDDEEIRIETDSKDSRVINKIVFGKVASCLFTRRVISTIGFILWV